MPKLQTLFDGVPSVERPVFAAVRMSNSDCEEVAANRSRSENTRYWGENISCLYLSQQPYQPQKTRED